MARFGENLVDGSDREDSVGRVVERLTRVDTVAGAGLEAKERGDGLEVVLDAVVDLLREDAAHDRASMFELGDPALRLAVELGVLDRLCDLVGDREQEVDLVLRELARRDRADVESSG